MVSWAPLRNSSEPLSPFPFPCSLFHFPLSLLFFPPQPSNPTKPPPPSDEEVKAVFETNVFGQLAVIRAIMPHMRARKSGVVANIGSVGGWSGGTGFGIYCATKFALVGITQALRTEVAHLGIDVTVIEPGYFRTSLLNT